VRTRLTGVATLSVLFLLSAAASIAQTPQAAPPQSRSPLSEIAHDFTSWLSRVTASPAHHHRATSSLPLPRPRPVEQPATPLASNKGPSELTAAPATPRSKTPPSILIND
jgi:hypothetical protein